jgi:hypothetical protein
MITGKRRAPIGQHADKASFVEVLLNLLLG